MILKSFILGNPVSLCMKIINSVVVVGLYYGFLTTFSIGPSYLFLLRARVIEEGIEKKVSATTGFITGQLMMFISIYYAPLHLALDRPHTITVLALPYLLFHFFWNNHKHFFDYGSTTRNSMRNLSIQCVFLNNLIFQLFNHFILPSSMLVRLVNIYMFRCNNKILFVTSSFVGWLIGHILFMKWVGLVLVWIQQNNSIRFNVLIRSNKYLVSELRNSMARIFSILLFITCVYYLGRVPSPIVTKKLKETSETEESEEETDVEIETTSETKGTKQEQEESTEEDPSLSLFSEEKEDPDKIKMDETEEIRMNGKEKTKDEFHFKETRYKNRPIYETSYLDGNQENSKLEMFKEIKDKERFLFEKPLVTILFDSKRWNRPFRYIKNDRFQNAVKNEIDGKERVSFTYPPSLSTFLKMIQRKISFFTIQKISYNELYNDWSYANEEKRNNISKKLIHRSETLDTGFLAPDTEKEYLTKIYDPLLNGPYRGQIKKLFLFSIRKKFLVNKMHGILISTNYTEFDQKVDLFDRKSLGKEMTYLLSKVAVKSTSNFNLKGIFLFPFTDNKQVRIDSEDRIKILKLLFDQVIMDPKDETIRQKDIHIGINEISKKVPRWSYKLIDELEQQERDKEDHVVEDHEIRSRKAKRVVILTDTTKNTDTNTNNKDTDNPDETDEVALIRYSQQSDFRRDIIKGSMRAQRRKTVIVELFEANENKKESEKTEEDKREKYNRDEKTRIEIAEAWDSLIVAQVIRGSLLVTQSILRKYILLPSLIIAKNTLRILLFQFPEWSEDFKDWNKEMHVKCTYNGVQLSEKEFPKNWLTDGIQIKILFPFRLKPWHRSKLRPPNKDPIKKEGKGQKNDFCFLTVWGMEAELPFEIYELSETQKEKNSTIHNQMSHESINAQLFLELTKKVINKYIYNNEANRERIDKTNQTYVFYKLSQTPVNNLDKLRSVFKYYGTSFFLKNEIREYFVGTQGIFDSEFRHKKPPNYGINEWKNWLKGHYQYQYDLSQIKWSRLVTQKCRTRFNHMTKNKDLNKLNNNQEISYNYNTPKRKLFDMLGGILIHNSLVEDDNLDIEKNSDRKYLDWKILHFCLRKKINIKAWVDIDNVTNRNKNTKTGFNNCQIIDKIDKKGLFYLTIHQDQKINPSNQQEILSHPISNLELWFFPEFVILYNTYKIKPWVIPIKLLFFNFNVNENVNKQKSITGNKKSFTLSNEKTLELENRNQIEKEFANQVDPEASLSNQEKDVEEDSRGLDIKKRRNKKQYKTNTETELELFLKRYFHFQLRWDDSLNQKIINNIKVYCLLLRLKNPREIAISAIQREEMSLDILMVRKGLTFTELMKKGILIIEPVRLSSKQQQSHQRYLEKSSACLHKNKKDFDESIALHKKMTGNRDKNNYDFLFPEKILSPRRRRELRIRICFNSGNGNGIHRNTVFCNFFLWPNYRLEDLSCMNRYWFDTNNGSRFSLIRIQIYPLLKIH
ncbi:hypothetical protein RGQ29_033021 [Quercus rubra]|uniref:Translocon at the inner envelope membrane of chloroplasts 214 n=1 Tax=Quercus rubra TaxID=3512 RepID=A0AAN7DW33_QUERU|nr:hypothetical protein RGQ29_033021 [Quercus rubra]